jgi:hypothetical protein
MQIKLSVRSIIIGAVLASLSACGGSSTGASAGSCAVIANCALPGAVSAVPPQQ